MKREVLNEYIGDKVRITFFDDTVEEGKLRFTTNFCEPEWKKGGYYNIGNTSFRCSHVKSIRYLDLPERV